MAYYKALSSDNPKEFVYYDERHIVSRTYSIDVISNNIDMII